MTWYIGFGMFMLAGWGMILWDLRTAPLMPNEEEENTNQ